MLVQTQQKKFKKISVDWGTLEIELLKKQRQIFLLAYSSEYLEKIVLGSSEGRKQLIFSILSFAEEDPELLSPFIRADSVTDYSFYRGIEYTVNPILGVNDYFYLLEMLCQKLIDEGYKVSRILREVRPYKMEGLKYFASGVSHVSNYINQAESTSLLDTLPQSVFNFAYKRGEPNE